MPLQSLKMVVCKPCSVSFFTFVKLFAALIAFLIFYLCGFDDNPVDKNPPCPPIRTDAPSAYSDPVWHSTGEFIGFNYTPNESIEYPYGEHCQGNIFGKMILQVFG